MNIPLKIGDIVLSGKFKNKPNVIKSFGKDQHNQPTIINDNGKEIKLLAIRIKKLMKEENMNLKNLINESPLMDSYLDKTSFSNSDLFYNFNKLILGLHKDIDLRAEMSKVFSKIFKKYPNDDCVKQLKKIIVKALNPKVFDHHDQDNLLA